MITKSNCTYLYELNPFLGIGICRIENCWCIFENEEFFFYNFRAFDTNTKDDNYHLLSLNITNCKNKHTEFIHLLFLDLWPGFQDLGPLCDMTLIIVFGHGNYYYFARIRYFSRVSAIFWRAITRLHCGWISVKMLSKKWISRGFFSSLFFWNYILSETKKRQSMFTVK